MQNIYITTSIPYVNSPPHMGHALELIQADAIARYYRLAGRKVFFQTGTDENAFKNVMAAQSRGMRVQTLVDQNSAIFAKLVNGLKISVNSFIRTTSQRHKNGVQAMWKKLQTDDIYLKSYKGEYCYGCEDFVNTKELIDGKCPEHMRLPLTIEEKNHFFKLSRYQEDIEGLIENGGLKIYPSARKKEILTFIKEGLHDISITRDADRAKGWGITVPGDPFQVIYVWIEALINYLSGPGYGNNEEWQEIWNKETKKIHVIGKNVWKFHAIYWPALLYSAKEILPDELFIHGFLTVDGQKLSRSEGNIIDPFDPLEKFGVDALRLYLLKEISPFLDGDFSYSKLEESYNRDLAGGLGNLVTRLTTLCESAGIDSFQPGSTPEPPEGFGSLIEEYRLDRALMNLWAIIDNINREIEHRRPWDTLKESDQASRQTIIEEIRHWLQELYKFAYWLEPFLPEASAAIKSILISPGIKKSPPLFPRRAWNTESLPTA